MLVRFGTLYGDQKHQVCDYGEVVVGILELALVSEAVPVCDSDTTPCKSREQISGKNRSRMGSTDELVFRYRMLVDMTSILYISAIRSTGIYTTWAHCCILAVSLISRVVFLSHMMHIPMD